MGRENNRFGGFFLGEGSSCFPACGSPAAGGCCVSNCTTACNDADCCQAVCAIDPFCCDVRWDPTCVSEVVLFPALCDCLP